MAATDLHLDESWFIRPCRQTAKALEPEAIVERPLPKQKAMLGWSVALGALGGAVGGVAMVLVADQIAERTLNGVDVVRMLGAQLAGIALEPFQLGIAVAALAGACAGALLGALMRYNLRPPARALAAALLAPALWTLLQAFVLRAFAPSLGALPFGPMVAGAVVFGVCATLIPPPREPTNRR